MTISRIMLVCGALAGMALAQGGSMSTSGGNPQATPQQQQPAQQAPVQQQPAATTQTPAQGAQQAPAQTPTGPVKHQPQAKTQDEYKAYQEAAAKPDPTSLEQAANDFATKYPTSELRSVLFQREMRSPALQQKALDRWA